jgi:hypothetical protein
MSDYAPRILTVAALVAIAGCGSGSAGQTPSTFQANSAFVHRGVPFVPGFRHTVVSRSAGATYSTRKSLIFEGDQDEAAVNIYKTKSVSSNPAPIATIHVANGCPYGLATDKKGTLYVADNCFSGDVEEYPKGSTTLKTTITTGISFPLGLAIDATGTLYVSNYPPSITEYPLGSTSPSKTVTGGGLTDPFGLALDSSGNLYIADFGADEVFELPAGGSSVTNLGLQGLGEPIGLALDKKTGYLWETDGSGNNVNVYNLAGSKSPVETIAGNGEPYAISLENQGKPKAEVVESDLGTHDVYAYKPGAYTPFATLSNGIDLPTGLLISVP